MKAISITVANNTQPVRYYPHGLPDRSPKDMEDDEKEEVLMTLSFDETKHDDNAFDTFLSQCFEEPVPRKLEEDAPAERSQSPCLSLLGDEFDDKDVNTTLPISPILQAKECMMLVMMQEMSAVDSKSDTIVENSFHNSVDDDSTAFLPRLNISLSMEPNSVASITAPDDETDLLINHDKVKKPSPLSLQMPTLSCKSLDSAWVASTDSQDQHDTARDTARDTVHSLNSSVTTTSTLSRPGSARGRTQLICTQALQRAQSISTALSTAFIEHQHQQVEQAQERKRLVAEKQQRKLKIQEREQQLLKKKQALLANAKQAKGFDSASFDQQQQGKTQSTTTTPLKTLPTTSLKSVSYDSYHPSKTSSSSSSSSLSPSIVPSSSSSSSSITSIATATTGLRSRSVSPATITKRLSPPSSTSVSHKRSIMAMTMTLPSSSAKVVKPVAMAVPKTKRTHSHDVDDDEDTGKSTVVKTVYPRSIVAKQKEIVVKIPLHCATNGTTSNTRK